MKESCQNSKDHFQPDKFTLVFPKRIYVTRAAVVKVLIISSLFIKIAFWIFFSKVFIKYHIYTVRRFFYISLNCAASLEVYIQFFVCLQYLVLEKSLFFQKSFGWLNMINMFILARICLTGSCVVFSGYITLCIIQKYVWHFPSLNPLIGSVLIIYISFVSFSFICFLVRKKVQNYYCGLSFPNPSLMKENLIFAVIVIDFCFCFASL